MDKIMEEGAWGPKIMDEGTIMEIEAKNDKTML